MNTVVEEIVLGVIDTYLRTLNKDLGCFDGWAVVTEDCYSSSWLVRVVNGVTKIFPYPDNISSDSVNVDDCYVALVSHHGISDKVLYFVSGPEYRDTIISKQSPNIFKPDSENLVLSNGSPCIDAPVCVIGHGSVVRAVNEYFDTGPYAAIVGWPIALAVQIEYQQGGKSYVREIDYSRDAMGRITLDLVDVDDVYVPINQGTDVTSVVIHTGNFAHLPHRVDYGPRELEYNTTKNLIHLVRWHRDMLGWQGDMYLPIPIKGHCSHLVVSDGEEFTVPGSIYWSPTVIRNMVRSLTAAVHGTEQNQTEQLLEMVTDVLREARLDIDLEEDMDEVVVWTMTPGPCGKDSRLMRYHVTADVLNDGVVSDHSVPKGARPTHPIGTLPFHDDKIMEIILTTSTGYTINVTVPNAYQTKDEE